MIPVQQQEVFGTGEQEARLLLDLGELFFIEGPDHLEIILFKIPIRRKVFFYEDTDMVQEVLLQVFQQDTL